MLNEASSLKSTDHNVSRIEFDRICAIHVEVRIQKFVAYGRVLRIIA
jgi:hypothetical protein